MRGLLALEQPRSLLAELADPRLDPVEPIRVSEQRRHRTAIAFDMGARKPADAGALANARVVVHWALLTQVPRNWYVQGAIPWAPRQVLLFVGPHLNG
jgi:hypothetical protein